MSKYVVPAGRVVMLLFFLGVSGFTAVVHICAMEASDCCGEMEDSSPDCCMCTTPPPVDGEQFQDASACNLSTTAGGLPPIQGVSEKVAPAKGQRTDVVHSATAPDAAVAFPHVSRRPAPAHPSRASTAPVEKYVLNASFLI